MNAKQVLFIPLPHLSFSRYASSLLIQSLHLKNKKPFFAPLPHLSFSRYASSLLIQSLHKTNQKIFFNKKGTS